MTIKKRWMIYDTTSLRFVLWAKTKWKRCRMPWIRRNFPVHISIQLRNQTQGRGNLVHLIQHLPHPLPALHLIQHLEAEAIPSASRGNVWVIKMSWLCVSTCNGATASQLPLVRRGAEQQQESEVIGNDTEQMLSLEQKTFTDIFSSTSS